MNLTMMDQGKPSRVVLTVNEVFSSVDVMVRVTVLRLLP
jgi:hypothetical protein